MPYKGSRTHASQANATKRKKENRAARDATLRAEADKLGIPVAELVKRRVDYAMPFKARVEKVVTVNPNAPRQVSDSISRWF